MLYTEKLKDGIQRSDRKKTQQSQLEIEQLKQKIRSSNKNSKIENAENLRTGQPTSMGRKSEKKNIKQISAGRPLRHSASAVPLSDSASHTPRFEVYLTHTLVAKQTPSSSIVKSSTNSILPKSRSDQLLTIHEQPMNAKQQFVPNVTNYHSIPEGTQKISKLATLTPEQTRSLSAVYKIQPKQEANLHKSSSHRLPPPTQAVLKTPIRPSSSSIGSKQFTIGHVSIIPNYESLNRIKDKGSSRIIDDSTDNQSMYYSLPRKPKTPLTANGGSNNVPTKRISSNPLYIDTGSSRKTKVSPITIPNSSIGTTTGTDGSDENLINFSQTLARAATNSPPIKRRSSSIILHSPNPKTNARFATKSTIDEIYTQKSRKDNYEKYKKVANEILRENLARKFGKDYPFNNQVRDDADHSSMESLSSTSSATDQQHSISSIPPDDIPLDIPNQYNDNHQSLDNAQELFVPQKSSDSPQHRDQDRDEDTNVLEGTVTSDGNHLEIVNNVYVSDNDDDNEDNDDSGEYNLDDGGGAQHQYNDGSDNDGDIEEFMALNPVERINEDLALANDLLSLPDHTHSQSFRIENTSVGSIVEVFVHADSLQRAKDALFIVPEQGILSKKPAGIQANKTRRALFDPHILLLDACLEPDYELVKELIPRISDISRSTIDGITALHNAVCSADAKVVLFLIQSGANVNASDADGWTPLHCAACCNNRKISKLLVENGASLFSMTLSDFEIPSQKCNKTNQEDTQCEEYLFWEQANLGVVNGGVVYSLFEYVPQSSDELTLEPNKILKVIDNNPPGETGWFLVEDISEMDSEPKQGMVPAAYVSCYPLIILKQH